MLAQVARSLCGPKWGRSSKLSMPRAASRAGCQASRAQFRLEYARALVDLGAAQRRDNSRSEARQLLRQGIELAHQCGASALVTLGNHELAATGAHQRTILLTGLDALTASGRRVAQMA